MYKKYGKHSVALILAIVVLSGCKDIVEEDISGMSVSIFTPPDSLVTSAYTHNFSWDENEDAIDYRLQIVTPDFSNPIEFNLDTTLEEASVYLTLNPGYYSWRLRAQNSSSETEWTTQILVIDTSSSLEGQILSLLSPTNNFVTSQDDVEFSWEEMSGASNYTWQLYEADGENVGAAFGEPEVTSLDEIQISVPEGDWWWRLVASNWMSLSDFSQRRITIDQTPPTQPSLIYPSGQTFVSDSVITFSWISGTDLLTSVTDSIYIWDDQDALVMSMLTTQMSQEYDLSALSTGEYEWEIITYDAADNYHLSDPETFTIE